MIDMWEREFKRLGYVVGKPRRPVLFRERKLTTHQNQLLREQAFCLLPKMNREEVIDTLLVENSFLSWRQAENIIKRIERIYRTELAA